MLSTQMAMESYPWMNLLSIIWQWVLQEKSLRSHLTPLMCADKNGEISYQEFMNAAEDSTEVQRKQSYPRLSLALSRIEY